MLCFIQSQVGVLKEPVFRFIVAPSNSDARRHNQRLSLATETDALVERIEEPLGDFGGDGEGWAVFDEDDELITAQLADTVGRSQRCPKALGDGLENLVSGRVPQSVVDDFESVEIQIEQCDRLMGSLGPLQHLASSVHEERPIGEACQRVLGGQLFQGFPSSSELGDVVARDDEALDGRIIEKVHDRQLEWYRTKAVMAHQTHFDDGRTFVGIATFHRSSERGAKVGLVVGIDDAEQRAAETERTVPS